MSNVMLSGAIGDALGVPFEMMEKFRRNSILGLWDRKIFLGSESHKLLPGNFSDDTQLSIECAESLINNGFDPVDLSKRYVKWLTSGEARGYGRTMSQAVQNLVDGLSWQNSGVTGSLGTGAAMRCAPFGVFFKDVDKMLEAVIIDAKITHNSPEAIIGAMTVSLCIFAKLNNKPLVDVWKKLPSSSIKESLFSLIFAKDYDSRVYLEKFGTSCDVRQAVPSAVALAYDTNLSYMEKVLLVAEFGGDTDTILSMAFQIMGADNMNFDPYHAKSIEKTNYLQDLDYRLCEARDGKAS